MMWLSACFQLNSAKTEVPWCSSSRWQHQMLQLVFRVAQPPFVHDLGIYNWYMLWRQSLIALPSYVIFAAYDVLFCSGHAVARPRIGADPSRLCNTYGTRGLVTFQTIVVSQWSSCRASPIAWCTSTWVTLALPSQVDTLQSNNGCIRFCCSECSEQNVFLSRNMIRSLWVSERILNSPQLDQLHPTRQSCNIHTSVHLKLTIIVFIN